MMSKILTFIIPTFNRADKLSQLLAKIVVEETVKNINFVVVDDFSSLEEKNKLKDLEVRYPDVDFIFNDTNRGACYARNTGAKLKSARWLWFFDDDDSIEIECLNRTVQDLCNYKNIHSLIFLSSKVIKNDKVTKTIVPNGNNLKQKFYSKGHEVNTSCVIFNIDLFNQIGGWDENLVAGQDTDIFLRASKISDATVFDNYFVDFIDHDDVRITKSPKKQMKAKLQFILKHYRNISPTRLIRYIVTFLFCVPYIKYNLSKFKY